MATLLADGKAAGRLNEPEYNARGSQPYRESPQVHQTTSRISHLEMPGFPVALGRMKATSGYGLYPPEPSEFDGQQPIWNPSIV
jgi:hypothetical protein